MTDARKRKANGPANADSKRSKTRSNEWRKHVHKPNDPSKTIHPGDRGVWATCSKGKERKCAFELLDLFSQELYPDMPGGDSGENRDAAQGIEDEIDKELAELKAPSAKSGAKPFEFVIPDMPCVIFIRCKEPVDPDDLVRRICTDAAADPGRNRTRFTLRMTPMRMVERASTEGLERACRSAFESTFWAADAEPKKYAIRTTIRNHNILKRTEVIKQVAELVVRDPSKGHSVDLAGFDLCVLVEIYKNVCGVAIVDRQYEVLKKYNLSEIFEPQPKGGDDKNGSPVRDDKKAEEAGAPAVVDSEA